MFSHPTIPAPGLALLKGPIEMTTSGSVIWTASPKQNGQLAVGNGKVFVVHGTSQLTVYNR